MTVRRLLWLAVGFTAACAVGVYLVSDSFLLLLGGICLCAGIPLHFIKNAKSAIATMVLLGCAFGFCWTWGYQRYYLDSVRDYDGKAIETSVEVTEYSYATDYGVAVDGYIRLDGKRYKIRNYLVGVRELSPGDQITGKIRLRMTVEGAKQQATHHQGDGIFLLGYVDEGATVEKVDSASNRYFAANLRKNILAYIDRIFPEDTVAFAKALLLGHTYDLSYEQDTAFKLSGIRHIVAVSGLHVAIVFSFVYFISGRRRLWTVLLGFPMLALFAALAGFTPSVVRACIMQALMILALLLNKEYDPPTALAGAVLTILLVNPIAVTSVGFQLSVGSVVGILMFTGRIHDYILRGKRVELVKGRSLGARLLRWIVNTVSVTLGAMIATTPLCAWYFGTVSIVGVFTNILTLWVVSFTFYGIMLSCVLAALWAPAGIAVAWAVSWPMRYVMLMAKLLSSLPLSAVYTCSIYIVVWLVFVYALLATLLLAKKKKPLLLVTCAAVGLLAATGASYLEPRMDNYRVTVLDVGQGACILFQSQGENYLVDCGGDDSKTVADQAAQLLLSQGVRSLDGVILTHYDEDHAGGLQYLITRIPVQKFYLPDIPDDGTNRKTLSEHDPDAVHFISRITQVQAKDFQFTLYPADETAKGNESCLCILFQRENYDILITGDRDASGEKALLEQAELPKLELLVVGHHGSANAAGIPLLEATEPSAAVISVGRDNHYGHPAWQVQTRLRLFRTKLYRTDLHGTIIFKG